MPLHEDTCTELEDTASSTKGGAPQQDRERYLVELAGYHGATVADRYLRRLSDFGYYTSDSPAVYPLARVGPMLTENLGGQLEYRWLEAHGYGGANGQGPGPDTRLLRYHTHAALVAVRARLALLQNRIALVGLAGAGVGLGFSQFNDVQNTSYGLATKLAAHVEYHLGMARVFVEGGIIQAPILENLVGNVYDSGGAYVSFGLRLRDRLRK